jgi:hypothetical protein
MIWAGFFDFGENENSGIQARYPQNHINHINPSSRLF